MDSSKQLQTFQPEEFLQFKESTTLSDCDVEAMQLFLCCGSLLTSQSSCSLHWARVKD